MSDQHPTDAQKFAEAAAKSERRGLLQEYWRFVRENKKWWLLPIVIAMLLLGLLIMLGGSSMAPFIYTLF